MQVKADARRARRAGAGRGPGGREPGQGGLAAEGNQELIAADRLIENLPALVEAAARGLAGANLTVLNGTQGVNEVVAGLVGQGMSILDLVKKAAAQRPRRRPRPRSRTAGARPS